MSNDNGNVVYADEPYMPVALFNEPGRFTILDGARESNEVTSDTDA